MITIRKPNSVTVEQLHAELAETLVTAYQALAHAQAVTAALFRYSNAVYAIAWDVAPILQTATETLRNLVTVHDLRRHHPFWSHTETPGAGAAGGTTVTALDNDLEAAAAALTDAETQAEKLARADHTYSVYGSIGWDLETAVDDVAAAVRTAQLLAGQGATR